MTVHRIQVGAIVMADQALIKLAAESRFRALKAMSSRRSEELRWEYNLVVRSYPHLKPEIERLALHLGAEERRRVYAQKNGQATSA